MPQFFSSPFLNFEVIRILGTTRYGGADIAEVLEAIGDINERDSDPSSSWHQAWSNQARHAETLALEAKSHGNRSAARSAFLRASNYARASGYLMTGPDFGTSDPRVVPILQKSTGLFHEALELFDTPVRKLEIPYIHDNGKKVNLPAYLYLPSPSATTQTRSQDSRGSKKPKVPLLVSLIGADSTQEEIYYMFPAAGPDLGYAVLTYEGPGQGNTLHDESISMRPDWENVNNVVVDYMVHYAAGAESESDPVQLDMGRIAVAGATLGGYYALRSAAGTTTHTDKRANQSRIKACVAIDPIYDFYEMVRNHVAPTFFGLWERGWVPDWVINTTVMQGTRWVFQMRWEVFTSARFLGVSTSPADLLRAMREYTLDRKEGGQESGSSCLRDVKCPTLVTAARASIYGLGAKDDGLADRFAQIGAEKKEMWVGETLGSGGLQAKMGALGLCNQRAFEFLDRQFGIKRESV